MYKIIEFDGHYPEIDPSVFIADNVIIIGKVTIKKNANIWYNCIIRADINQIYIGENTNIQDNCTIHVDEKNSTYIGINITIGHCCLLHGCRVEDHAFVGMSSTLLDNSKMQNYSMLGANSLLTNNKTIKQHELWKGSPAKFARNLSEQEIQHIQKSADNYCNLAQKYKHFI